MIRPSTFAEILEHKDLLAEYAAECSIPAIGPINPQAATYAFLEQAGVMQCFGAYKDGEMVGFGSVLMSVFPHYGRKVATVESLFVSKAHRGSSAGLKLMQAIEGFVEDKGCVGILYSSPAGGKLEKVLERASRYRRTNTVFYRSLA